MHLQLSTTADNTSAKDPRISHAVPSLKKRQNTNKHALVTEKTNKEELVCNALDHIAHLQPQIS